MRISQSVKAAVAQKASLPFELKVLEALLAGGWGEALLLSGGWIGIYGRGRQLPVV